MVMVEFTKEDEYRAELKKRIKVEYNSQARYAEEIGMSPAYVRGRVNGHGDLNKMFLAINEKLLGVSLVEDLGPSKKDLQQKTTNQAYLGTYAFDEGEEMIVQIKDVRTEMVQNAQGREEKPVAYFENGVKPLILNTTNMKAIQKATGSPYMDEWVGKKIQLYVDKWIPAFGTVTDGVRVREFSPR